MISRFGASFGGASFDVGAGARVGAHAGEHDPPQGMVGLAVAAAVEPVAGRLAGRGVDRGDAAEVREGGFGGDAVRRCRRRRRAGSRRCGCRRRRASSRLGAVACTSGASSRVEALGVGVDVDDAAAEGVHGQLGGVHDGVTAAVGSQRRRGRERGLDGNATEPFPQLIGCGEAEMAELVEALDAHVAPGAVATSSARIASTLPSAVLAIPAARPDSAARAASTASMVSDLPCPAPRLTVRAIDLDHLDATAAKKRARPAP